jgi:putative membrane protein
MIPLIINIIVLALALLIISKIPPLGVQVDSIDKALIGGAIIGFFSGIGNLFPNFLTTGIAVLSLGLIPFIISVIIFAVAAKLVDGFRLVYGIWSAITGAIALGIVSSILNYILSLIF